MTRSRVAEQALHDQTQLLPKKELLIVFSIIALSLCICAAEQNGIGVLLPSIARDLDAQATITWAGTSALIANTVFQVLYGRLSDLFGRKKIMLSALVLLALCDLACGLSINSTMLYIFRGLAGHTPGTRKIPRYLRRDGGDGQRMWYRDLCHIFSKQRC
jgi:MFS family permease